MVHALAARLQTFGRAHVLFNGSIRSGRNIMEVTDDSTSQNRDGGAHDRGVW
jgi:hypothetical protein